MQTVMLDETTVSKLRLYIIQQKRQFINMLVASYLSAIATIVFYNFWKVVIDCIKLQPAFRASSDSARQNFTDAAGSENEFIAIGFPFLKVIDK